MGGLWSLLLKAHGGQIHASLGPWSAVSEVALGSLLRQLDTEACRETVLTYRAIEASSC